MYPMWSSDLGLSFSLGCSSIILAYTCRTRRLSTGHFVVAFCSSIISLSCLPWCSFAFFSRAKHLEHCHRGSQKSPCSQLLWYQFWQVLHWTMSWPLLGIKQWQYTRQFHSYKTQESFWSDKTTALSYLTMSLASKAYSLSTFCFLTSGEWSSSPPWKLLLRLSCFPLLVIIFATYPLSFFKVCLKECRRPSFSWGLIFSLWMSIFDQKRKMWFTGFMLFRYLRSWLWLCQS